MQMASSTALADAGSNPAVQPLPPKLPLRPDSSDPGPNLHHRTVAEPRAGQTRRTAKTVDRARPPIPAPMPVPSAGHRIAVLGGSFDPITDGHLKCACELVHGKVADEVWIVPCGRRPDKPSLKTPYMHRLIMWAAPWSCDAVAWAFTAAGLGGISSSIARACNDEPHPTANTSPVLL